MKTGRTRVWMSMVLLVGIAVLGVGLPAGAASTAAGAPSAPQGVEDASCSAPGPHGFSDVPSNHYANTAIAWLVEANITAGTQPGTYSPNNPVTRAQMAVFLHRNADAPVPASPHTFSDVPSNHYANTAIAWLVEANITAGTQPGKYSPNNPVTRAQMAVFVYNNVCATSIVIPAPTTPATLIIGDSNTFGHEHTALNTWAHQLPSCTPKIWAFGGVGVWFESPWGHDSLVKSYVKMLAEQPGPKHVVIMLGTNDTSAGYPGIPIGQPAQIAQQLDLISASLIEAGAASVRWMTIPPRDSGAPSGIRARMNRFNAGVMLTQHPIDARGAFGSTLPAKYRSDEIHLNAAGHVRLANYVDAEICTGFGPA